MITETFFRNWIIELFSNKPIKWITIQDALTNNHNLDDFPLPVHNKVKGDIFEHIVKYIFIFKGIISTLWISKLSTCPDFVLSFCAHRLFVTIDTRNAITNNKGNFFKSIFNKIIF